MEWEQTVSLDVRFNFDLKNSAVNGKNLTLTLVFFLVLLETCFLKALIGNLHQVIAENTPKFSELAPKYESSAHHS
jgi:hypothetical protein